MSENHTNIVVVLLPRDAQGDEHVTMVYAGDIDGTFTAYEHSLQEITGRLASMFHPFPAVVESHERFGDVGETPVAIVESPHLHSIRHCLEHFHNSQWGFRPHISAVGAQLRPIGSQVWFNRIAVWYGPNRSSWALGQSRAMTSLR